MGFEPFMTGSKSAVFLSSFVLSSCFYKGEVKFTNPMVACELTWNINFNEKNLCSNAQVRGGCDHTNKLILTFKMKTRDIPVNDVLFGRSRPTKVRGRWLGNCKEAGQATDIRGKKLKTTMLSNFLESEVFHFMSRKRSFAKSLKHCSKSCYFSTLSRFPTVLF